MSDSPRLASEITADMQHRRFEAVAHHFFMKWQPKDPDEAHRFSAELFSLVRQIYMDAAAPQSKLMADILACLPPRAF